MSHTKMAGTTVVGWGRIDKNVGLKKKTKEKAPRQGEFGKKKKRWSHAAPMAKKENKAKNGKS